MTEQVTHLPKLKDFVVSLIKDLKVIMLPLLLNFGSKIEKNINKFINRSPPIKCLTTERYSLLSKNKAYPFHSLVFSIKPVLLEVQDR